MKTAPSAVRTAPTTKDELWRMYADEFAGRTKAEAKVKELEKEVERLKKRGILPRLAKLFGCAKSACEKLDGVIKPAD